MGTQFHVNVVVVEQEAINPDLEQSIQDRLNAINQSMSTYLTDSELSQVNQNNSLDWIAVSDNLFAVLTLANRVSEQTDGAFDITVAPLVSLWGFGSEDRGEDLLPSDKDIQSLLGSVGYQKLQLLAEKKSLKKPEKVQLDLSAIAKGFAVDDIGQLIQALGYSNYMVEIGGEIVANGHNVHGQPWRIGIETPSLDHSGVQRAISISGVGVATSGDYRNYFEIDGQRYSHTIDPLSGRPITHNLASVTVVASTAAQADALATAISVLGPSPGKALAEKQNWAAYFIVKNNDGFESDYTPAFEQYLR